MEEYLSQLIFDLNLTKGQHAEIKKIVAHKKLIAPQDWTGWEARFMLYKLALAVKDGLTATDLGFKDDEED